ncbi:MAG: 3-methylornithine--L-lysine ligase PylC [Bacillota bacterium]
MRVAVVGGRLQGVEACYLAKKAGWEVVLVDKEANVPASGLCDEFHCLDVVKLDNQLAAIIKGVDLVLPAFENWTALALLNDVCFKEGIPCAFDLDAYAISSSKLKSDKLFAEIGVPAPTPWPKCSFPVIIKPSGLSGSEGVLKAHDMHQYNLLASRLALDESSWVVQEFLDGPSYSVEVIGRPGNYKVLQVTELFMDARYDCKRVIAPASLSEADKEQFAQITLKIAQAVKLRGIMDVEVILHNGELKVLEIDARLPSQTPTVVYKSAGLNMVDVLGELFVNGCSLQDLKINEKAGAIFEHIRVSPGKMEVLGEHIMGEAGPLFLINDFFGADEAITNYAPGKEYWAATLIVSGDNRKLAWDKRRRVVERLKNEFAILEYEDLDPVVEDGERFL